MNFNQICMIKNHYDQQLVNEQTLNLLNTKYNYKQQQILIRERERERDRQRDRQTECARARLMFVCAGLFHREICLICHKYVTTMAQFLSSKMLHLKQTSEERIHII